MVRLGERENGETERSRLLTRSQLQGAANRLAPSFEVFQGKVRERPTSCPPGVSSMHSAADCCVAVFIRLSKSI